DQKTGQQLTKIDLSPKKPYKKDPIFSKEKSYDRYPMYIHFNPKSSRLAVILDIYLTQKGQKREVLVAIFDTKTGSIVTTLSWPSAFGNPTAVALSPDGTQLAVGFSSNALLIHTLPDAFIKQLAQLSLPQAQLVFYIEQNKIRNFNQLPEYLWALFNSL